jgi:hypothetical protein
MYLKKWKVSAFKMAEIEFALKQNYQAYISTFKETSLDDHHKDKANEYLCNDEAHEVYNFDKIIAHRYPNPNDYRPQAFDALYIDKTNVYCIEFKNQTNPTNSEVVGKLVDGKKELDKILGEINVNKEVYKFIYCVVHKNCKTRPFTRYKCGIEKEIPRFSLASYKGDIIDDIFTEDVNFFSKQFKKKTTKDLQC